MDRIHQGKSFNFQILSSLSYFLECDLDYLAFEGMTYEDSIFRKANTIVAIGEAKYRSSKKNWTLNALFFENGKGPFAQLWNNDRKEVDLLFFTNKDIDKKLNFENFGIKISDNDLQRILEKLKNNEQINKNPNIRDLKNFISRIQIFKSDIKTLENKLQESLNDENYKTNLENIRYFMGYINSDSYKSGEFVHRTNILKKLSIKESENKKQLDYKTINSNNIFHKIYFELIWSRKYQDFLSSFLKYNPEYLKENVQQSIEKLLESKFIKYIDYDEKVVLKSTYRPLFEYIQNNIIKRKDNSKKEEYMSLTSLDEIIFKKIFNSKWFLKILTTNVGNPVEHTIQLHNGEIIRLKKSLCPSTPILSYLANFLEEIFTVSGIFYRKLQNYNIFPHISEFNKKISFDEFTSIWLEKQIENLNIDSFITNEFRLAQKYLGDYESTKIFLQSLLNNKTWLCIPIEFVLKMLTIERVQMTFLAAFGMIN
ncbi:hypothetical protein LCGC14_1065330 [marine sediment metagenome]|uniref:Uncharacterized protein n=1 Tax=marine sediment metagenome TaxID=412755 RepID=A0A0F9N6U3_9ZZZZ